MDLKKSISEFDLAGRLQKLHESLNDVSLTKPIVSRLQSDAAKFALLEDNGIPVYHDRTVLNFAKLANQVGLTLSRHLHEPEVKGFINELNGFIQSYDIRFILEHTIQQLEFSKTAKVFGVAIDKLVEAREQENLEFFIVENLDSSKWIPEVRGLSDLCAKRTDGKAAVTSKNGISVSDVYSVVEKTEHGFKFFVDGTEFELNENAVTIAKTPISDKTKDLQKTFLGCSVSEKRMTFFPNAKSMVTFDFDTKKLAANGTEILAENLVSGMLATGDIGYGDVPKVNAFLELVKESESIAKVDFAHLVSNPLMKNRAAIFKTGGSVAVHRHNVELNERKFEILDASTAVNEMKRFVKYDISEMVVDLLPESFASDVAKKEKIQFHQKRISDLETLHENIDAKAISEGIKSSDAIAKTKKFITEKIQEERSLLTALLEEKDSQGNEHFVPGETVVDLGGLKKGAAVSINAIQYEKAGPEDEVEYSDKSATEAQFSKTLKKNLYVKP